MWISSAPVCHVHFCIKRKARAAACVQGQNADKTGKGTRRGREREGRGRRGDSCLLGGEKLDRIVNALSRMLLWLAYKYSYSAVSIFGAVNIVNM